MGKEHIALIDIIPDDVDEDFEALIKKVKGILPDTCTVEAYDVMPVAFGLEKARLRIRYPEEWGGTDKLEEMLGKLDGLQGIEAIAFSKA